MDALILTHGSSEKTIHAVELAERALLQARQSAGSVMTLRPAVACSAMLDVKTADLKDDSEGEFNTVLARVFWLVRRLPSQQ